MTLEVFRGLLDGPRARGAFLLKAEMDPPWGLRVEDRAPLTIVVVARGQAALIAETATQLDEGDVLLARGPAPYTIADSAETEPRISILTDQRCHDPDGRLLAEEMAQGVRTWGNSRHGATSMLIGTYPDEGAVGRRLLTALPDTVVLRARDWESPLIPLLAEELTRDAPGQEPVLDRLLDLVVVSALRSWLTRSDAPRWYLAQADPDIGRALRLIHREPAQPWTVRSLASAVGMSRASFARRFSELVGEPPMTYLTGWRLDLAADLLADPDATVSSVARQVGYADAFAFSAAFKRVRGISPTAHRSRFAAAV